MIGSGTLTLGLLQTSGAGVRWVIGHGSINMRAGMADGIGSRLPPPPPPPPKIALLRDALVTDINATVKPSSPTAFVAEPAYSVVDSEALKVCVLGVDLTEEHDAAKETDTQHLQIHVVVRQKVEPTDVAENDRLLALVNAIATRYKLDTDVSQLSAELASIGQTVLVEKRWFPLYHRYLMDTTGFFHSELVLTFREWVDRP
jgi:hypothetical protein